MSVIIGDGYCLCLLTLFSWRELLIQHTLLSFLGMVNELHLLSCWHPHSLYCCGAKTPSPTRWSNSFFENLQMDSRYWVRHKMHRFGIWVNVKVYLFMWIYIKSFIKHLFVLTYSTQGKSAFWCASMWMSPFMTSTTSVFSYMASRISVAKLLSQSSPKISFLAWMWNMSPMVIKCVWIQTSRWTKWDGLIKPFHVSFWAVWLESSLG